MCGISGYVDPTAGTSADELRAVVRRMADTLRHRGPDGDGVWVDERAGIAFGHRRLSIIDLSEAGAQPMASGDGRFVLAYNGEIYNHRSLRDELALCGHRFRGQSDTEVMVRAFCEWGVREAVTRMNGMFAFALWDGVERTLHLARDRLGKKPLYYGWVGRHFLFGSELRALAAHPAFDADIDVGALALYVRYNYVPSPHSIYEHVHKLPPGTLLSVSAFEAGARPEPVSYWSAVETAAEALARPRTESAAELTDELEALLSDAVRIRMISDVPLGALLSGGIDSSLVTALMQREANEPVRTFNVGYEDRGYDESAHAQSIAAHLRTEHTELRVSAAEVLDVIPRLPSLYDEPFADASQVPTFLVSRLARQAVTVGLSGDGGDELFGGYNRHLWGPAVWEHMSAMPRPVSRLLGRCIALLSPAAWDRLLCAVPAARRPRMAGEKLHKLSDLLASGDADRIYERLVSHWPEPAALVKAAREPASVISRTDVPAFPSLAERMMFLDAISYLPDDLLTKVDRASMAVSLEVRCPLLDYRVVEFAWRLPLALKIRERQGKWLLRQLLYRLVPPALVDRPKMGFAVPIGDWLRGPLREWGEGLVGRLRDNARLQPEPILQKWREHQRGTRNWQYHLWSLFMFQAWLDEPRAVRPAGA